MNKKKVKIIWNDTTMYSPKNKEKSLSPMETIGLLEKEDDLYIVIKDPVTKRIGDGSEHPQKRPTFYLIPKGMIVSTEDL